MICKNIGVRLAALALSLSAFSTSSEIFAATELCGDSSSHEPIAREGVTPAQAIYQDETPFLAVADQPIPFTVKGFKTNFHVNSARSVFEVKVAGLYSIDSYLIVGVPTIGNSVAGYITINERKLLPFYSQESSLLTPLAELHFTDRLVYLEAGDEISIILSEFAPGTSVLSRGLTIVALNNSHHTL